MADNNEVEEEKYLFQPRGVADLWMSRSSGSSENSKATTAFAVVKAEKIIFLVFQFKSF